MRLVNITLNDMNDGTLSWVLAQYIPLLAISPFDLIDAVNLESFKMPSEIAVHLIFHNEMESNETKNVR